MDFVTFLSRLYGNGEETEQRLRSVGYTTPQSLSGLTPEKLSAVTGLSLSHSRCMTDYAREELEEEEEGAENLLAGIEGVGEKRARLLRKRGLATVEAVAAAEEENLARMLKVPKPAACRIIKSARNLAGWVPGRGITAEEAGVVASEALMEESRGKKGVKAPSQSTDSFWRFG